VPFGGMKESGYGRSHGREGLRHFTQPCGLATGAPPQPLDVATVLRQPGHYRLAAGLMRLVFGTSPAQKLEPVREVARDQGQRLNPARLAAIVGLSGLAAGLAFAFGLRGARHRRR